MSLELRNIRKNYQEPGGGSLPVLNIPEFTMQRGDQVALVGTSGGGKTTLLNVISGITTPDAGTVTIDGTDVTKLPEPARDRFRAERIGFIFQTFNLLPAFSALENVLLGMSFSRGKSNKEQAKALLDKMGLGNRLNHSPAQLSVGEQQRVAIARALVNSPSLILADEPTASVDPANKETILDLIKQLCNEQNVSLLLVTHDQEIAQRFDRITPMQEFNTVLQQA